MKYLPFFLKIASGINIMISVFVVFGTFSVLINASKDNSPKTTSPKRKVESGIVIKDGNSQVLAATTSKNGPSMGIYGNTAKSQSPSVLAATTTSSTSTSTNASALEKNLKTNDAAEFWTETGDAKSLGTKGNPFNSLNLKNASVDKDGNLSIDGKSATFGDKDNKSKNTYEFNGKIKTNKLTVSKDLNVKGQYLNLGGGGGSLFMDDTNIVFDLPDENGSFQLKNSSGTVKALIEDDGDSYFMGGNVGIGTASPNTLLTIYGTSTQSGSIANFYNVENSNSKNNIIALKRIRSDSTAPSAGFGGQLEFDLEGFSSGSSTAASAIGSSWENNQTNNTTDRDANLTFFTMQNNSITEKLRITSDGSIGFGETSPTATLHINKDTSTASDVLLRAVSDVGSTNNTVFRVDADGNVYAEQAFNGSGADVAEYYDSLDGSGADLDEGTVVSVDHKTYIKKSGGVGDSKVIGVVSTKPGVVLGYSETSDDSRVRIALVGRVPVKVSTENGKIEVGDELAASSKEGVAMKASSDSKVVIGRALESYDGTLDGDKKILVLMNTHVK